MKLTTVVTTILMLALISVASVSAVDYEAPIWFLDSNGDGLIDDTDGDGKTTMMDWALLYGYRNFIAGNYPDMLPRFDYNGDGVTDSRDLDYAYLHLTGKLPPKVQPPQPAQTPKPYISPGGYWYPNGERANYEKTPSITIGWNPEDAPKMNRPALPESGVLPPLKRWG